MRRKLFTLCSAVSLLLCLAVCGLWVLTYFRRYEIRYFRPTRDDRIDFLAVQFDNGTALISSGHTLFAPGEGVTWEEVLRELHGTQSLGWELRLRAPDASSLRRPWSFRYEPEALPAGLVIRGVSEAANRYILFPLWAVVLPLAIFATPWIARLRRSRRRRRLRLCPACGYDLRATPGRCPECGAVPAR